VRIEDANVAIITHYLVKGAGQELEEFLKERRPPVLVAISHPLRSGTSRSECRFYVSGELHRRWTFPGVRLPAVVEYASHVVLTLWWLLRTGKRFHLVVAVDGLNTVAGALVRWLGRTDKLVFYTIDYVLRRFEQPWLNAIYHAIDRFAVRRADQVWNLSPRMVQGREGRGMDKRYRSKQVTVPIGIHIDRLPRLPIEEIDRYAVAYVGELSEKQGVQLLVEAAPAILAQVPKARFVVIGGGDFESQLREAVDRARLANRFVFHGWVRDRQRMETLLGRCAVGVALYRPDPLNFSYYADPTKPKDYLGLGLPVLITDVPHVARDVVAARAGLMVEYEAAAVAKATIDLLTDNALYTVMRANALAFAQDYQWESVFSTALERLGFPIDQRRES